MRLASSAQELASQAEAMQEMVSRFQIDPAPRPVRCHHGARAPRATVGLAWSEAPREPSQCPARRHGRALLAVPHGGGALAVPFDVQVPLMLKALTYDRSLKTRVGGPGSHRHRAPAQGEHARRRRAAGRRFATLPEPHPERPARHVPGDRRSTDDAARGRSRCADGRWAAAYVMPGFSSEDLAKIRRVCAARRSWPWPPTPTTWNTGLAFGVGAGAASRSSWSTCRARKACGSDFDLALLSCPG